MTDPGAVHRPAVDGGLATTRNLTALAAESARADRASLFLLDPEDNRLECAAVLERCPDVDLVVDRPPPDPEDSDATALLVAALGGDAPVVIPDFVGPGSLPPSWRREVAPGAAVLTRIGDAEGVLGLLVLGWDHPQQFEDRALSLIRFASESIAVSLAGAIGAQARDVVDAMCGVLADDLAAHTGRVLSAVKLHTGLLRVVADDDLADDVGHVQDLVRLGLEHVERYRSTVATLKGRTGDPIEEIFELAEQFARRHPEHVDVDLDVDIDGVGLLPPAHAQALLVAAREGLSNVERHADAHRVRLSLTREDADVVFRVRDDGVGPAARPDRSPLGVGIELVQQAAWLLGGQVALEPCDPGTELRVSLPFTAREVVDAEVG